MEDPLSLALRQHQLGRLHEAGRMYQDILSRNPNHADALHLLGVVAHQLGQNQQAAQLIGRAIALRPDIPAYHANLGEVWRALGQVSQAADSCRAALRLQPNYPEAANNLGLALLAAGDTSGALDQFHTAIRLRPDFGMAHNNLGNTLRSQGDTKAAIAEFREAVRCEPRLAEARSNLGQLLCERNEFQEALVHCSEAVRLRPSFPEALSNLGNVLRELGRLDEAKAHYAEAMRLNPGIGMVYNNMAQALQEEGKLDDAFAWYQQALQRDPNSARIHCNLASALGEKDLYEEAVARYEVALRLDPNCAEAYNGLGFVRHEQDRDDEARTHYQTALRLKPDFAPALCNFGTLLEEHNELEEAQKCFRSALRNDSSHAGALAQLAIMLRSKLPDEDLAAMRRLLAESEQLEGKRTVLHFGLAQTLDARGEYAEAAEHLRQANALSLSGWRKRGRAYDRASHTQFVTEMIATCTPEWFERVRGLGLDSERPVFIVGLPRSGTTLVEQVLSSHSQVFGAGELRFAREDFEALPTAMYSGDAAMACMGRLDREAICIVGQRHLARLHSLNSAAPRIVDKMPDNYMYVGLLTALFPKAKFIHCRRDLRDIAVSCWMTNFRQIRWASDPDDIASRFHEYQRLMEHWRAVLPVPLLDVHYEDTVADLESVARRLVAWCGLEWEPACLAFHETKRPVRTASVTQVRQPVYTRSVARWKHYQPALSDLFARLIPSSAG
ncbi:MAG TPA: tetratricopeptide repeat protein [Gemmataceae bacterium]|jgi:tetratricopeptide (TPR) repeat protein